MKPRIHSEFRPDPGRQYIVRRWWIVTYPKTGYQRIYRTWAEALYAVKLYWTTD